MDIFNLLTLIGGLCLFLFGMDLMGQALERRAGSSLRTVLSKLTTKKIIGLLTGLGVTAVIQSSSATTVMVVGFVNSGLMTLKQAINVIMGANIGTTVTAWILSLTGIESENIFVQLLKPMSFTPILALFGIIFYMFFKDSKRRDTGIILLGFATLMFGMDIMSDSVSGLSKVQQFRELFILFKNPILGVLVGAVLTAIIQSSSASVGILQALAATGQVSYGAAIPIIMGQNIGTCVTALLSSFGANRNAKRAAFVHLFFNIIGTVIMLAVFLIVKALFAPVFLDTSASLFGIAVAHSLFNIICTIILYPMSGVLETIATRLVPAPKTEEKSEMFDERLLSTPPVALELCAKKAVEMGYLAVGSLTKSLSMFEKYSSDTAKEIRDAEEVVDRFEDSIGTYLVKLSGKQLSTEESAEVAKLLKAIGDFERISDHALNLLESVEEMRDKDIKFSDNGLQELRVMLSAVSEILDLSLSAFTENNLESAMDTEPLEKVITKLKNKMRSQHIARLQKGECSITAGFIWADLLTNLERTAAHCSNISGGIIDIFNNNFSIHETLRNLRTDNEDFDIKFEAFSKKYSL